MNILRILIKYIIQKRCKHEWHTTWVDFAVCTTYCTKCDKNKTE